MKTCQVIFQPSGRRGEIEEGMTILEASRELGAEIESVCGGARVCGKCKIKLEEGFFEGYGITSLSQNLSPFSAEEGKFISADEAAQGFRLSCAAQIRGDVLLFIPEESRAVEQVVRKDPTERFIQLNPAVTLHYLELSPPTLHDPMGDFDRVKKALLEEYRIDVLTIDYLSLLHLPKTLRQGNWKVTVAVWMDREILSIRPGKADHACGLAVDIGTTTVAGYLCDLQDGKVVATESMMNPQVTFGEDVMSRITYCVNHPEDGLEKMHRSIVDGLNRLIRTITEGAHLSPEEILELTIVGNTAMHHFFLKIDPDYVAMPPFTPAIHRSIDVKARDLGLKVHPSANVHVLPIEAGFVGADNVGVLIAEEPYRQDDNILIIDIGTNGELVMGSRKLLISSSCATGPALEGAYIRFGMRAAPGAIERIEIDPGTFKVKFKVIGREEWHSEEDPPEAKGICGSGIIDGMAELFRTGIIDKSGRFRKTLPTPRFKLDGGKPEFVIAWAGETSIRKDITITQQDVRNVQLAKGALYTGAKLMMRRLGIEKLDRIILAGAFGSFINKKSALILGMFPDCDLENVIAVGNAAGDGARIALLNREKRREADEVAGKVEYIELTTEKDFQKEFMEAMRIPHGKDPFPHLKGIVREEMML